MPVVNVGFSDVLLYPGKVVGVLHDIHVVSLPSGVKDFPSYSATVAFQVATPTLQDQMGAMDLSALSIGA